MSEIEVVNPTDVGEDAIASADVEIKSTNGQWIKVGALSKENGREQTVSFEETPVQFVRIVIKENANKWYQIAEVSSNETTFTVTELRKNTNYGFKVVSKYSNGEKSKPVSENVRTKK